MYSTHLETAYKDSTGTCAVAEYFSFYLNLIVLNLSGHS